MKNSEWLVPTTSNKGNPTVKNSETNLWLVTTEGDVEGKSTHTVGFFKGKVQDILGHFAEKGIGPYYSFHFKLIETTVVELNKTAFNSEVSFHGQNFDKQPEKLKEFLGNDSDVEITKGSYYETLKFSRKPQTEKFDAVKVANELIRDLLTRQVVNNVKAMGRSSHDFAAIGKNVSENLEEVMDIVRNWFVQNHKFVMEYTLEVRKYPGTEEFVPCLMIDFRDRW